MNNEEEADAEALAQAIIAFFHALPAATRREYEALAEIDREKGEDVSR